MRSIRLSNMCARTGLAVLALACSLAWGAPPAKPTPKPPATKTPAATTQPAAKTPVARPQPATPQTKSAPTAPPTTKPATTPEPKKPAPTPAAKPEPKKPAATPVAKPEPKKPAPAPVAKPEPKKPAPTPVAKPEPKKPAPTPVAKPEPKKPAPTPVAKPEPKKPAPAPVAKVEPKSPTTQPVAKVEPKKPATQPAGEPEPKKPAATVAAKEKANIIFQFEDVPLTDVVRRFSQMVGKPLMGDINIPGTLTFYDSQPYTQEEALDTLNIMLAMRGYMLMETGRFLTLTPLAQIPSSQHIKIIKGGLPEADERHVREGEIVTMVLPLKSIDADTASKAVVRMVSAYGSIAPLGKGTGLIITDHLSNIRRIATLLDSLEGRDMSPQKMEMIELERASAKAVADLVNQLFGRTSGSTAYSIYRRRTSSSSSRTPAPPDDRVYATADSRTNIVFLVGSGDRLEMAKDLVEKLDSKEVTRVSDMQIVELANAKAEDLVKTITPLLPTRTISYGGKYTKEVPDARVVADAATNRLIISASPDKMDGIRDTIKELDKESTISGGVKIFPLKVAEATQLAPIVSAAVARQTAYSRYSSYSRYRSSSSSSSGSVSVTPDPRTNSLIVVGPATEIKAAESLIKELDRELQEGTAAREIHVVNLPAGNAATLAATLGRLLGEGGSSSPYSRYGSRSTSKSGIRIEAEPSTNSLLISCTPSDWKRVKELLDKIIPPPPPGAPAPKPTLLPVPITKIIALQFTKASEIAQTLQTIFAARRRVEQVAVIIVPNEQTNSLLVSAAEADINAMTDLIAQLDVKPSEPIDSIEIYELKVADAPKVAEALRTMVPQQSSTSYSRYSRYSRYGSSAASSPVLIYADAATNSVFVRAPQSQRKTIADLIAKLDREDQKTARVMRIVPLKNVPASQIVQVVSQFHGASGSSAYSRYSRYGRSSGSGEDERVVITPAPGDQAVIVEAPNKKIDEIVQLIETLDKDDAPTRQEIRTYRITNGSASEVAANLEAIFTDTSSSRYRRGSTTSGERPPRFQVNAASNQLLVSATARQFEEIEKLLQQIQAGSEVASATKTFQLKHAQAEEVVNVLTTMLGVSSGYSPYSRYRRGAPEAELRLAVVPGANAILMQGPPNKITQAEELLKSLDTEAAGGASVVHIIQLKNQSAATLAVTLQSMLAQQTRGRTRAEQIFIQPDTVTNSILIRASESRRKEVEELIAKLDTVVTPVREMRVIPVQHTSAAVLAQTIQAMYQRFTSVRRGRSSAIDPSEQIVVYNAPDDKAVIVDAPIKKMEEIAKLVEQLDTGESAGDTEIRTYQMTGASASELAATLTDIFRQRWQDQYRANPRTAPPQATFHANAATNQLIVSATARDWEEIEQTITKMEKASVEATASKTIELKHADPQEMITLLQAMFTGSQPAPYSRYSRYRASTPSASDVRMTSLPGSNKIVLQGPPEKIAKAEQLIKTFDTPDAEGASVVEIVALKNQKASALAQTILGMLPRSRTGEQSVFVTADTLTNSLLIRADAKNRKMVLALVAKLDAATEAVREMKIIKVQHASAEKVAETVRTMFASMQQAGGSSRYSRYRTPTTDPSEQITITTSPDDRSIIIDAPAKKMPEIESLIASLDVQGASRELLVRTYQLKNAKATDLASSLGQIYTARAAEERRTNPRTALPSPTFQANATTNQLIIGATAAQLEEIEKSIADVEKASVAALATKTFTLTHADADELVGMLQTMLADTPAVSRYRYGRPATPAASDLRISTVTGSNTIVVQGSADKIARAEQLIATFDTPAATADSLIQMVPLKNQDAYTVANTLRTMLPTTRGESQIYIQADSVTNSVLIRAPQKQRTMVEQLIAKLDTVAQPTREMTVVAVRFASAYQIATTVQTMFGQATTTSSRYSRYGSRAATANGGDEIRISASPDDRSVIVDAPVRKTKDILALIAKLDVQESSRELLVRTYQLKDAKAPDLASSLGEIYTARWREEQRKNPRNAPPQPSFQASASTNQLIVGATAAQLEEIEKSIADVEKASVAAASTKTFELKHADANELVDVLRTMLTGSQTASRSRYSRYGRPSTSGEPEIRVTTLAGTNKIVVQGPPDAIARAEQLIATFDTPDAEGASVIEMVALKNQDATKLATTLRAMLPAPSEAKQQVTVEPNPLTNTLLVRAPQKQRNMVADLIAKLDTAARATRELRVIPAKFVPAHQLAEAVSTVFSRAAPASGYSRYGRRTPTSDSADRVTVTASPDDKMVIVDAPTRKMAQIAQLVAQLDAEGASDAAEIQTYQLTNANATELAESLTKIYTQRWQAEQKRNPRATTPQPTFDANASTNQLIISASAAQLVEIKKSIEEIEKASQLTSTTKTFPLKHARAEQLLPVLQTMLQGESSSRSSRYSRYSRYGRSRSSSSTQAELRLAAVPGANAIVVQGPPNQVTKAEQLIQSFDTPDAAAASQVYFVELKNANAATVARTLQAMLPTSAGRDAASEQKIFIQADPSTNSVLIRAPQADRKEIEGMIAKLDTAPESLRQMRVFKLANTSANLLAGTLQTMYAKYTQSSTTRSPYSRYGRSATPTVEPGEEIVITPSPNDQSLVVEAPAKKMDEIAAMVEKLDVEDDATRLNVRTYTLSDDANPAQLAQSLSRLYAQQRSRSTTGVQPEPRFEGDAASHQLIVAATNQQFEEIEKLIKELDKTTGLAMQVASFALQHVKAEAILPTLQAMLVGQSATPSYSRYGAARASTNQVRISAMPATNTLYVQGPPSKIALAKQLIESLDTVEAAESVVIEIVQLQNSQAPSLADAVNAMLQVQASRTTRTGGASADTRVVVTAEPNSNSLLVRGPARDVPKVVETIKKLDQGGTTGQTQVRVFPLKNSDATDLVSSMGRLFQDISRQQSRGAKNITPPPFSIAADQRTNSLVISTTPQHFKIVEQLLENLDQPAELRDVKIVFLESANATETATQLQALYADRAASEQPSIEADEFSNTLTIIAKDKDMTDIESVVAKLDKASKEVQIRVVPVSRMKADKMAELIKRVYGQMSDRKIIITDKLPTKVPPGSGVQIFQPAPDRHAPEKPDADRKTPKKPAADRGAPEKPAANRKAPAKPAGAGTPKSKPRAKSAANPKTKSAPSARKRAAKPNTGPKGPIGPTGPKAPPGKTGPKKPGKGAPKPTKPVLTTTRRPAPAKPTTRPAPKPATPPGGAPSTRPSTQPTTQPAGEAGEGEDAEGEPITISIDPLSNSLIISGTSKELDDIQSIIDELSVGDLTEAEYRTFKIEQADPISVAQTLEELFNPKPVKINVPASARGRIELPAAPPPVITVVPDARTRTVIVRAKPLDFEIIEPLIKHLDSVAPAKAQLRVFVLENTDAAEVAKNLQDLFQTATAQPGGSSRTPSRSSRSSRGRSSTDRRSAMMRQMIEMQMAGAKSAKVDPSAAVSISANTHTNSVIVSASAEVMALVEKIIQDLDQSAAKSKVAVITMYPLKHAEVAPTVQALQTIFAGTTRRTTSLRGRTSGPAPEAPIIITGDEAARTVIVSAPADKHELIAKVLNDIDTARAGTDSSVRVYKLETADASSVAAALTASIAKGGASSARGRRTPSAAGGAGPRISADRSSNAIVVRASAEDHTLIAKLIAELDVSLTDKHAVQMIPLASADPTNVAAILNRVFGGSAGSVRGRRTTTTGRENVVIEADADSRMLLVRADDETFAKIRELAAKLDAAGPEGKAVQTLIALKHAQAAAVASALQQAFSPRARSRRGAPTNPDDLVSIVAEPTSNSIIVTANKKNLADVQALLAKLDTETAGGIRTELMVLTRAKATDVATALSRVAGASGSRSRGRGGVSTAGVTISADAASNTLILSGPSIELSKLMLMAKQLDQATTKEIPGTYILPLARGDAANVARMVQTIYSQQVQIARQDRKSIDPLAVSSDSEANALVLATTPEMFAQVKDWVSKVEAMKKDLGEPKLITLKHADPAEVEQAIRSVLLSGQGSAARSRRGRTSSTGAGRIQIAVLAEQRALLVKAPAEDLATIEALIAKLDAEAPAGKAERTIIALQHARADTLATALARAFLPARGQRIKPEDTVSITAEPASNSIIVTANAENLAKVQSLLAKLDIEGAGTKTQFMVLKNAKAVELARVLTQAVGRSSSRGRGAVGAQPVTIAADAASNALVLSGPATEVGKVMLMAEQLDQAATEAQTKVFIVTLTNGDAGDTAALIQQLYTQQVTAARREGKSIDPLAVSADEQANSLVLATTDKMHQQVTTWVAEVEKLRVGADEPKMIVLKNADPDEVADAIRTVFVGGTAATRGRRGRTTTGGGKIQIAVLAEQRALLIKAPEKDFTAIQALVAKLDAEVPTGKAARTIIALKHAKADTLAASLSRAFLPARGQRLKPDDVVTITAEPASNSIIVTANAENLAKVQSLLAKLDVEEAGVKTEMLILTNARATELAGVLARVLVSQRGRTAQPVMISPDAASNALVISGPASEVARIRTMAEQLDQKAVASETDVFIVKLTNGEAADVAQMVMDLYNQQVATARRGGGTVDPLAVTPDVQANALILATNARMHKKVLGWITSIEDMKPGKIVPKVIPLQYADPTEVQKAIQQVFVPGQPTRRGGRQVGQIEIVALPQQQALLVKAGKEDLAAIESLAKSMDTAVPANEATRTIIALKHAQAAAIATALSQAFGTSSRGRRTTTSTNDQVTVTAEPFSNSVIVTANAKNLAKVQALLAQLDTAEAGPSAKFVILQNAKAAELATVLARVVPRTRGAQGVSISADAASNALVLSGPAAEVAKVEKMAGELDVASAVGQSKRTIIPLTHAKADSVATALNSAFTPQRGQRLSPDDLVRVVAEPLSNSLIVLANDENLKKVKALLASLDAEGSGTQTQLLMLRFSKATDLLPVLQQMARAQGGKGTAGVTVSADAGANALVMSGPGDELDKMMKMAQQLDTAAVDTLPGVHTIQLTKGDATEVAATLQQLYQQMALMARTQKRTIEPMAVSVDQRSNSLIVATTKPFMAEVTKLVQQIETMAPKRGNLRLITVEHANPEDVEKAIRQLYELQGAKGPPGRRGRTGRPPAGGTSSGSGRVETTVLPEQRAILIDATDEDFEAIVKLAKALDEAAAKVRREVKLYKLKYANNTKIATALTTMYRSVARAGRPEDQVTVTALPQTNAVVVAAGKDKHADIAKLIEQLDQPDVSPKMTFKTYALKNAEPIKILPALTKMIAPLQKTQPDKPITVQADQRTRTIIVTARGEVFDEIEKLIQALDVKPADPEAQVLVIPLKQADAPRLASVLQEMLRPSTTTQVTAEARELQEQIRLLNLKMPKGRQIPPLDLRKPIKITSDPATSGQQGSNSLIVSSTEENLKAVEAIVGVLDRVPLTDGVRVRVVRLKNADATTAMSVLREIFDQAAQRLTGRKGSVQSGKAEPESTSGKALTSGVAMAVDMRTNTLIVSGTEEALAFAELVLMDLDSVGGKIITEVRVFRLKYADATRLSAVLQAVFTEGRPTTGTEGVNTYVTRLQTVLEQEKQKDKNPKAPPKGKAGGADNGGHTSEVPKTRAALTIQADQSTNMLVVAARSDIMPLIADVIQTMDVPGAGSLGSVRIIPLVNADATRIQQVITQLYAGPAAQLVRAEDKPTITADTRTNSLIVATNDKTFATIEALVKRLDAKQPIDLRDIKLVPLKNAEAADLAKSLQQMMDARVQRQQSLGIKDAETYRVIVTADQRSNSLMVGGSAEGLKLVAELAKQLDDAAPALQGQVQILPLKEANAGTMAKTLDELFTQRYAAARTPDVKRQQPVILPDLRLNALLIAANADDTKAITGLLKRLDVKPTDPAVTIVVIPMQHNDAGAVGPTIEKMFDARLKSMTAPGQTASPQDKVDIEIDSLTNSLIVSASKENHSLIRELLKKVDIEPPDKTGVVRVFALKTADAQRVATLLQGLIQQGLYKPGMVAAGQNAALAAREKVAIAVDIRTNSLIVSASRENYAVLDEIIKQLDGAEDYTLLSDVRIFTLKRAKADRLAQTLQQLWTAKRAAEREAGSSGRSLNVTFIPDIRTNTMLVAGSRESFKAVELMIKQLDADSAVPATEFRVFTLQHATAAAVAPTIQRLFLQRPGGTKDTVTIIPDSRVNSLIVGATPDDMKVVESVVERLDIAPDKTGKTTYVFPLAKADAKQVASTLESLFRSQGTAGAAMPVTISVDERINAIIVSAGSADVERIRDLVKQLDTENVTKVTEIRVFPLENADAEDLAKILTEVLTTKPKPLTNASANRQTLLQFLSTTPGGKDLITQTLQEAVLVTSDRRTNSLVVTAPTKSMSLLENLIHALDAASAKIAEIRVFTLKNADATKLADVLRELFRLRKGTDEAGAKGRSLSFTLVRDAKPKGDKKDDKDAAPTPGSPKAAAPTPAGTTATPTAEVGPGQEYVLSVTVDVRTNSLLVGGTKQYVALCEQVIQELDSSPIQERQTQIYRLRNAKASDIQTALRTFLDQERQKLTSVLGQEGIGAAQRLLDHEVAIVAEETSNTLLLSASPRYFKTVAAIIEELDQPPPQVLIQVLLAEVTLDDTTDLGFEWMYNAQKHDSAGNVTRSASVGTGFGVEAAIGAEGGFSASLTSGDFSFFLRALQSQGKLEILSRPQILASDNQQARINIGQRVPFVTNTRVTDSGSVFNTIQYEDVGVILDVTPRINPDGFVKLDVAPEISTLSTSSVQISEGVESPIIASRKAETTVSVQDGHTIVIGGLITTKDEERESKVPIIGDMPIVGFLFRETTTIKERTELLIILTPHVIRNIGDADTITDKQLKRLDLLRKVQQDELKEYLFRPSDTLDATGRDIRHPATRRPGTTGILPLESLIDIDRKVKERENGTRGLPTIPTQPGKTPAGAADQKAHKDNADDHLPVGPKK